MAELYVSVDVETDGPIPGPHSMLSLGCAVYTEQKELIDTFSANLTTLPGATEHPDTMRWWKTQPKAWAECRRDQEDPAEVMMRHVEWLNKLPGTPVFVAYPASFDFMFVYWYLMRFVGESPYSFSALDIKSYAMAVLNSEFNATTKKRMPRYWFDSLPHTHKALDDAVAQGALFCNIRSIRRKTKYIHKRCA